MTEDATMLLLVEDSPFDSLLLQEYLGRAKYETFEFDTAESLAEALDALDRRTYDAVLLDLTLPDSHGIATVEAIVSKAPAAPIVVLTGDDDHALAIGAVDAGAQDFLTKGSFTTDLLARTVRHAIQRKQAEEALKLSTERFRLIFESSPDAIVLLRRDGCVEAVNGRLTDWLGYTVDEVRGRRLDRLPLLAPEDMQTAVHALQRRLAGKTVDGYELKFLDRSNQPRYGWVTGTVLRGGGATEPLDLVMISDITDLKAAERTLRRRDSILKAAAESACMLLRDSPDGARTQRALSVLGGGTDVSRVYVFENGRGPGGDQVTSQRFEWVADGVTPQIGNPGLQDLSYEQAGFERWRDVLSRDGLISGPVEDFPAEERAILEPQDIRSIVVAPIWVKSTWWGFIGFDDCREARVWSEGELEALSMAASTVGAYLERGAVETELRDVYRRERQTAARIQKDLLLGHVPRHLPNVDIAALTVPSQDVDGDFYDFLRHGSTAVDIILGDVMGKGTPAAMLGAGVKAQILKATANIDLRHFHRPAAVVDEVDEGISSQLIRLESFVTLLYLRIDFRIRALDYVDCGHTRALQYHARDGTVTPLAGRNMPLGFVPNQSYQGELAPYDTGDVILLYSDGITEAVDAAGTFYGEERLVEFLARNAGCHPPDVLLKQLHETVVGFAETRRFADDLTCVAARIVPNPAVKHVPPMVLSGGMECLKDIRAFVTDACSGLPAPGPGTEDLSDLILGVNEAVANVVEHACDRQEGEIGVAAFPTAEDILIRVRHQGKCFQAGDVLDSTFDLSRSRGFGLGIMARTLDTVQHLNDHDDHRSVAIYKRWSNAGDDLDLGQTGVD